MPKPPKKDQRPAITVTPPYKTLPWTCTHFGNMSEIDAFIPATNQWETIAQVNSVNGIDAEDMAAFIVHIVNDYKEKLDRLHESDRIVTSIEKTKS